MPKLYRVTFYLLLATLLFVPTVAGQTLLFDDFADEASTDAGSTGFFTLSDLIAQEREVDNTNNSFAIANADGSLLTTMDFFDSFRLVYDGADEDVVSFNHKGLDSLDLSAISDAIKFGGVLPQLSGVTIDIALYTDAENASWARRIVGALLDPTDVIIPFSSFNILLGDGADFSNIGALEVIVSSNGQTQVLIGSIGLNEPPLPVELTSFTSRRNEHEIILSWETASETNNAGFSVEHLSPSATEYIELGFILGSGTTTDPRSYEYRVNADQPGQHLFRLKQIDFDGTTSYSDAIVQHVNVDDQYTLTQAYPNPFNPSSSFLLSVNRSQYVRITLHDAAGREAAGIFDGQLEGNMEHQFVIDGSSLASGMYWYRVEGAYFQTSGRVILAK